MKVVVVDASAASRNFYRMLLGHAYHQSGAETRSGVETGPIRGALAREAAAGGAVSGNAAVRQWNPEKPNPERPNPGEPNPGSLRHQHDIATFSGHAFPPAASVLTVHEAANGAEGLKLCRSSAPDCVLLDYKLPDMTGLEFLEQLNQHQMNEEPAAVPTCAVVLLTGLVTERIAVDALQAGAQDYLLKDRVSAESLRLAVDKATGKVRLIRALQEERDRLAASLAEKEVLLKEVHHRVKNNLQVIVSLLRLQAQVIHDGRLADALRESQDRVETMALIHEQLYETTDLREVDLARHASLLITKLFNSYGAEPSRIEKRIDIAPLPLPVDQAIPAGLILNELISNALKHAFPAGRTGVLEVRGGRTEGGIYFEVADDGVGLPAGIDVARPGSLGLEIVNILTRQLKGTVTVRRRVGGEIANPSGTAFCVVFPNEVRK